MHPSYEKQQQHNIQAGWFLQWKIDKKENKPINFRHTESGVVGEQKLFFYPLNHFRTLLSTIKKIDCQIRTLKERTILFIIS